MAGVLTSGREAAAVAESSVGTNLDEAANVALNFAAEVTFDLVIAVQNLSKMAHFLLGQIANLHARGDAGFLKKLNDVVLADAINEGEGILSRLIPWKVDTCDTCHKFFLVLDGPQPCRCLCFGLTQITRTTPSRLMILHLSQIFLTLALTFI